MVLIGTGGCALCAGDINWEGFTFPHGFRILRPRYEPVPLSPLPGTESAPVPGLKSEAGSTPVKVQQQPHGFSNAQRCMTTKSDTADAIPWVEYVVSAFFLC